MADRSQNIALTTNNMSVGRFIAYQLMLDRGAHLVTHRSDKSTASLP